MALAGSGALADGKPVPIKLLLSGKFEVLGGYAAQRQSFEKSSDADVDGTTHYGAFNILSSSEIHVTGSTRLENGLTVSVVVEFEGDQFTHNGTGSDNAIDKSYLAVAGSFGQIRIGSTNAGSHDLVNTAPNVGALSHDGGDTDDWILQPGNSVVGGPDTDIGAGDITRIAYVSQEIGGFTLGASYQPTAATTETMPAIGGNSGADAQTYDIGIAYAGMFGQAAFSADVQYYRVQGGAAVSVESWRGGANLRLGRLALGGSLPAAPRYRQRRFRHRRQLRWGRMGNRLYLCRFRLERRIGHGHREQAALQCGSRRRFGHQVCARRVL
ncbi:MAG: porin [Rhodospirillales bacterium]